MSAMALERHARVSGILAAVGFGLLLGRVVAACALTPARPAAYGAELAACTERSATLCESVRCENDARARYARPPRQMPASCADGGAP